MLRVSENFKQLVLLNFTNELIKHTKKGEILLLQREVENEEFNKAKESVQQVTPQETPKVNLPPLKKSVEFPPPQSQISQTQPFIANGRPVNKQPLGNQNLNPMRTSPKSGAVFPESLSLIKPVPTAVVLDLGKLNKLVNDPLVNSIECSGADERVTVRSSVGAQVTNITLSKDEIDDVIDKFSKQSRIPVQEGTYRVAVGRLILTAIISNVVSSKFVIKKMDFNPAPLLR